MRLFKESSSKRIVMSPSSSVKRFEISSEVPVVMYFLREKERELEQYILRTKKSVLAIVFLDSFLFRHEMTNIRTDGMFQQGTYL